MKCTHCNGTGAIDDYHTIILDELSITVSNVDGKRYIDGKEIVDGEWSNLIHEVPHSRGQFIFSRRKYDLLLEDGTRLQNITDTEPYEHPYWEDGVHMSLNPVYPVDEPRYQKEKQ